MPKSEVEATVLDLTHKNINNESLLAPALADRVDWDTIILSDNSLKSINILSTQQNLRVLYLNGTLIEELTYVPSFNSLEILYLSDMPIKEIAAISTKFKNLKALYLTGTFITDLTGIEGLLHLEELSLSDTPLKKGSLVKLYSLQNLKKLYLEGLDLDASSILALKVLSNLEYLEVNYEPELQFAKDELFKDIAKQKQAKEKQAKDTILPLFFSGQTPSIAPTFFSPSTSKEPEIALPPKGISSFPMSLSQIKMFVLQLKREEIKELGSWINNDVLAAQASDIKILSSQT